jgi:hypothetical protein
MMQATAQNMPQIKDEFIAAMANFETFCDRWAWIEDKANKTAIKLKLWPAQREVLGALTTADLLELLKTRQIGLTWLVALLVLWLAIKNILHLTVIISASEDHAIEFLDRVYFAYDRLPDWMKPPVSARTRQVLEFITKDRANSLQDLRSTIKSMPTIEMGAESKTPNLLIIDEAHTIRNVGQIFGASLPGIEQAKGRVIVIANSVKTGSGWPWVRDTYMASQRGDNNFKRIFLPWMAHPERPADFRERMIMSGMGAEDVSQHYPATEAEALQATTGGYFGKSLLRHPLDNTLKGWIGTITKNNLNEYELEEERGGIGELWRIPYHAEKDYDGQPWLRRYCIGSDVSEGLGLSYSVAYVLDRLHNEFVFRLRSNRVDAYTWAELLDRLSSYYDRALLCVERTGAGQTVVKKLMELGAPQYQRLIPGSASDNQVGMEIGWQENEQRKNDMSEDLRNWFATTTGTVYCPVLLDEAATWIKAEGSRRIGPEGGKLGDCVIAAGMTIEASIFLGSSPEKTVAPITGWLGRIHKQYDREAARVM